MVRALPVLWWQPWSNGGEMVKKVNYQPVLLSKESYSSISITLCIVVMSVLNKFWQKEWMVNGSNHDGWYCYYWSTKLDSQTHCGYSAIIGICVSCKWSFRSEILNQQNGDRTDNNHKHNMHTIEITSTGLAQTKQKSAPSIHNKRHLDQQNGFANWHGVLALTIQT